MLRQLITGTRQFHSGRNAGRNAGRAGKPRSTEKMQRAPSTPPENRGPSRAELGVVKRKVALVLSYVGSKYHGLQLATQEGIETVESVLLRTLLDIGAVRPSNAESLQKIKWSRASRTDKGVHAARIVLSLKLEIHKDWVPPSLHPTNHETTENVSYHKVVELLNEKLPEDIRVMSCVRVNDSFTARTACTWREYQYTIPTDILTRPLQYLPLSEDTKSWDYLPTPEEVSRRYSAFDCTTQTEVQALERLNAALAQFVGTQSYHNFHNLRASELTKKRHPKRQQVNPADTEDLNMDSGLQSLVETDMDRDHLKDENIDDADADEEEEPLVEEEVSERNVAVHDSWTPTERPMAQKLVRTMYVVRGELRKLPNGQSLIGVTLRGDSFTLNQIRLMIGAAILVARGMVPPNTISASLKIPYTLRAPIMPAEGLYLQYGGFGFSGSQYVALSQESAANLSAPEAILMDQEAFQRSEEFKMNHIQPRVLQDWYENDAHLLNNWLRFAERFRPSHEVAALWQEILVDEEEFQAERQARALIARQKRIDFALNQQAYEAEQGYNSKNSDRDNNNKSRGNKDNHALHYAALLPERFYTDLVIHFNAYPGLVVERAVRALTYQIETGRMARDLSTDNYIEYMRHIAVQSTQNEAVDVLRYWATSMGKVSKIRN
eukprot:gene17987-20492_t